MEPHAQLPLERRVPEPIVPRPPDADPQVARRLSLSVPPLPLNPLPRQEPRIDLDNPDNPPRPAPAPAPQNPPQNQPIVLRPGQPATTPPAQTPKAPNVGQCVGCVLKCIALVPLVAAASPIIGLMAIGWTASAVADSVTEKDGSFIGGMAMGVMKLIKPWSTQVQGFQAGLTGMSLTDSKKAARHAMAVQRIMAELAAMQGAAPAPLPAPNIPPAPGGLPGAVIPQHPGAAAPVPVVQPPISRDEAEKQRRDAAAAEAAAVARRRGELAPAVPPPPVIPN